jgi:ketosteroid isomerase-like protein
MLEAKQMRTISTLFLGFAAVLFLGVAAVSRIAAQNADPRAADRAKITAVLTAQQTAWNRGDVDSFIVGYWESPELTFSGSGGIARGFDGVRQRYKKNYPDRAAMGELAFSGLEFRFLGSDAALVLGKWHLKRDNGDVGGVFSLVWQRFPDGWKIIHDHTSTVDAK